MFRTISVASMKSVARAFAEAREVVEDYGSS